MVLSTMITPRMICLSMSKLYVFLYAHDTYMHDLNYLHWSQLATSTQTVATIKPGLPHPKKQLTVNPVF